jgi:hypothetical protein
LAAVFQAANLDGLLFDGLLSAKTVSPRVCWCQVVDALVLTMVVVVVDGGGDTKSS